MHPFTNPFTTDTSQLTAAKIVDRVSELSDLRSAVTNKHNALILGPNAIGKTCLLKKLRDDLTKHSPQIMLVEVDMVSLSRDVTSFLKDVLLRITIHAWVNLTNRKYSELLQSLDGRDDVFDSLRSNVRELIEMFRIIRPATARPAAEQQNTIGLKTIASKQETFTTQLERGDLAPSEFIELAAELMDTLRAFSVKQVVVFGDEANHIRKDLEVDLFKSNFEAFAKHDIQFVFTAREEVLTSVPELTEAFPVVKRVEGFKTSENIRQLIDEYVKCSDCGEDPHVTFPPDIVEWLWKATRGRPNDVQRLAAHCCTRVMEQDRRTVELSDVLDAVISTAAR